MIEDELTEKIIQAFFEVSNEPGAGFLESEVPLKFRFRIAVVGDYFADLIVEERILIEIKAVSRILQEQVNYLTATGIEVGLLVNFDTPRIEYFRLHRKTDPVYPVHPV